MNGFIRHISILALFCLTSCQNYYFLKEQRVESDNQSYSKFKLYFDQGKNQIDFYTYADYVYNKVDKQYIYFTSSEMRKLLYHNIPQNYTEQFLFMYTYQPTFSNILGFYYKGVSIEEVKKRYSEIPHKEDLNQVFSRYSFGKFQVFDLFKKVDGGVIRFVAINNPNYPKDPNYKNFNKEINDMFFENNNLLWDGYVEPIN
ncbi:hypothetical protein B0A69_04965 [Chryseobacterium shigense]|uniref:Uncharacterized protein n=1 Tax=Chryseobacterium shigense TaxID=297244 RepID=A0A1N7IN83_9FLAO|nr:hypothetical protein [Chryseobacterium shigense]PQA95725.1 hypothetical protein B0A69_04965 [Chryseobacterium shigense]SIS38563.1 hypothetical protein SAMN05421639_104273 [Chryseobacterium shigense]